MASPASIARHPIHPMLIVFPVALFVVAFLCDVGFLITGHSIYGTVAYYCIAAGIVGGLLAAVPGLIDYGSITDPKVKRIGMWHMLLNIAVVILFAISLYLRNQAGMQATGGSKTLPFALAFIGVVLLGISGWLGGEMVYVYGVAVEKDAPHTYASK